MKKVLETAMILMGTLGFWGFVYPDFCLTEETYKVESVGEEEAYVFEGADKLLVPGAYAEADDSATGNKIVVKSKLMEYLFLLKDAHEEQETNIN